MPVASNEADNDSYAGEYNVNTLLSCTSSKTCAGDKGIVLLILALALKRGLWSDPSFYHWEETARYALQLRLLVS